MKSEAKLANFECMNVLMTFMQQDTNRLPWINQQILRAMKLRDSLYNQYRQNRRFQIPHDMLEITRQVYNTYIKRTKQQH